jgi:D-sedoheptulose 7-phosphate isomerase
MRTNENLLQGYVSTLANVVCNGVATDRGGTVMPLSDAVLTMGEEMRKCHANGNRVFFLGNGGSAGISSHMATDYSKNGGIRSSSLNDGSTITCVSNDYGYEYVFSKQLEWHARAGDAIVAISSSGKSASILNAVGVGRERDCSVFTLSGFAPENPLRTLGDINIFLSSFDYGFVEVGHLTFLHAVLDVHLGWKPSERN